MTEPKPDTAARRLAANVRAVREQRGLSQAALAQKMFDQGFSTFSQQRIGEIESGSRGVKIDEALGLARALAVSLDSLTRPRELTSAAGALVTAAVEVKETRREADTWLLKHAAARDRLERELTRAAKHETELADEIAFAVRTLSETDR